MVLLALATDLVGSWILARKLAKPVEYGEANPKRWKEQWAMFSAETDVSWPCSQLIEVTGGCVEACEGDCADPIRRIPYRRISRRLY